MKMFCYDPISKKLSRQLFQKFLKTINLIVCNNTFSNGVYHKIVDFVLDQVITRLTSMDIRKEAKKSTDPDITSNYSSKCLKNG